MDFKFLTDLLPDHVLAYYIIDLLLGAMRWLVFCGAIINENGQILTLKTLPSPSNPLVVQTDSNLFTWILDSHPSKRRLYKMDFDGNILLEKIFASSYLVNAMVLSGDETVVVYDSGSGNLSGFNSEGTLIEESGALPAGCNAITTNLSGGIVGTVWTDICVDNQGFKWECLPIGGIKKSTIDDSSFITILTGYTATNITCDSSDRIWFTFGANSYMTVDSETRTVLTSGTVGSATTINKRGIALTREERINGKTDVVWMSFADNNTIYKMETNGTVIKTISLIPYGIAPWQTKFTSYDWNRKFNYIANNYQPQIECLFPHI